MYRVVPSKRILQYLFVFLMLIPLYSQHISYEHEILAATSFPLQEMIAKPHDWIDILNKNHTSHGDKYTDITTITYFSDGRTLNATLWLASFNPTPDTDTRITYGMLIDADSNKKTGIHGIDYNIEILWNGTTKTWTRIMEQYSSSGGQRTLSVIHNYTDFFGIADRYGYILLSSDVNSLGFSNRYKVLFYAGEIKNRSSWLMDFSNWANNPPPEATLSSPPRSIVLRPGEEKKLDLQLNSTANSPSIVFLSTNRTSAIKADISPNPVRIDPSSTAFSTIRVYAPMNASANPYIFPIFANVTFPNQSIGFANNSTLDIPQESIATQFTLPIIVLPTLTAAEKFAESTNTVQYTISPQTLASLFGIVATAIVGWVVPRILESVATRRKIKNLAGYMNEIHILHDTRNQNKQTYLENLERLMRKIEDNYARGEINESQFTILKDKISGYIEEADNS